MKLVFSARAVDDLSRLRRFITEHDPQAAARISDRLRRMIATLTEFPLRGRGVAQLENIRELVAGHYVIRYRPMPDRVEILRIWHGREYRD